MNQQNHKVKNTENNKGKKKEVKVEHVIPLTIHRDRSRLFSETHWYPGKRFDSSLSYKSLIIIATLDILTSSFRVLLLPWVCTHKYGRPASGQNTLLAGGQSENVKEFRGLLVRNVYFHDQVARLGSTSGVMTAGNSEQHVPVFAPRHTPNSRSVLHVRKEEGQN